MILVRPWKLSYAVQPSLTIQREFILPVGVVITLLLDSSIGEDEIIETLSVTEASGTLLGECERLEEVEFLLC